MVTASVESKYLPWLASLYTIIEQKKELLVRLVKYFEEENQVYLKGFACLTN